MGGTGLDDVRGGRVADRLPGAYELSEHRLQSILTPTQAIESLS